MKAPALLLVLAAALAAQSFDTKCEPLHERSDVIQRGCSITGSRSAAVNFIYIRP
jgi:hypothetical protein